MRKQCELLSVDLFDTVIRRKCHPDTIKYYTSMYVYIKYHDILKKDFSSIKILTKKRIEVEKRIGEYCKTKGYDDEYILEDVIRIWCEEILNLEKISSKQITKELYYKELEIECYFVYLDPNIIQTIESFSFDKLVCISDFYADSIFIDTLLKKIKFPLTFDYKYISCECKLNKRSGRLFDYVNKDMGIDFSKQIHIGDNWNSDYIIPKSKGINALHYLHQEDSLKRKKTTLFHQKIKDSSFHPKITDEISYLFYGFISWIIEEAIKKDITTIYFFTREGEFFYKIYEQFVKYNPYGGILLPEGKILEVSRLSTFAASLQAVSLDEMMRIWNQYSVQTMYAFFTSLNISFEKVEKYLTRYNILPYIQFIEPWTHESIQKLFLDIEFINFMKSQIEELRTNLVSYCIQEGMSTTKQEKIAIVDIGWRGTIQDNLGYIFPNYEIHGFYMGLLPFLNVQPKNCKKYGYINKYKYSNSMLLISTPLEMLCNSPNGSVIGYENVDNRIKTIKKISDEENKIYFNYTQYIQKRVIQDIIILTQYSKQYYKTSDFFYSIACKSLKNFIFYPKHEYSKYYFQLRHNEEFGRGEFVTHYLSFSFRFFFKALFNSKKRIELKKFLVSTTWPQGYFVYFRLYPLLWIYNKLLEVLY